MKTNPKKYQIYTNSPGMEFVLVQAGEFQMGSPSYPGKLFDTDSPVYNVNILKHFYMSKYEVTQKEWTFGDGNTSIDIGSWIINK